MKTFKQSPIKITMVKPPETIGEVLKVIKNRHGYNNIVLGEIFKIEPSRLGTQMHAENWYASERITILGWLRENKFIE